MCKRGAIDFKSRDVVSFPSGKDEQYWNYSTHTSIKHRILSYYLRLWSSKLGSVANQIVFWDCFAGRGVYYEGQPGSPLLVLEESRRCGERVKLICICIEKDTSSFKTLQATLRKLYPEMENDRWFAFNSNYIDIYHQAMNGDIHELDGLTTCPSLFFLDPTGFKDIPLSIVRNMMSRSAREVFITLMVEDVKRHRRNEKVLHHFKELFGEERLDELDDLCGQPNPELAIADYYEKRLNDRNGANVKYTLKFELKPTYRDVVKYYLIFGSNHPDGLGAMHRTMRAISNNRDFSYRGRSEGQTSLESFLEDGDLIQEIADWIYGLPFRIGNLRLVKFHAYRSTNYSDKDVRTAVVRLIRERKLEFHPPDETAKKKGVVGNRYFRRVK
ncbi:MAG: three-Cys-motif partner protein TcmP [Candidatus Thorarchaeota archaeon]